MRAAGLDRSASGFCHEHTHLKVVSGRLLIETADVEHGHHLGEVGLLGIDVEQRAGSVYVGARHSVGGEYVGLRSHLGLSGVFIVGASGEAYGQHTEKPYI